jgi:hypothetical protein
MEDFVIDGGFFLFPCLPLEHKHELQVKTNQAQGLDSVRAAGRNYALGFHMHNADQRQL